ncbi:MAG: hypothetical protein UT17_C0003G0267 [Candidatus Woesebacteria bacterium GW2011_GWB1_39_10]|uniref:Uncharacterized protein n=2 Tax=Candidatus Woeseibacteriota TaxID=1752722 RepID=A0A0G0P2B8_9BACT|nr:MAG: hypothetical protein UT17_C0003G0267 [Candidatus Woesebacteria bacterium GW2011_GWB1_39_10]KKS91204.1 MAG: hypothetical protein UV66_C0001G0561 [Candidatus Woesebacteria bacterium GW2011_GWA1_43_12]
MLEKDYAIKISSALASSYYKKWVGYFEKVLRATRSKRHKDKKDVLLAMQLKLAQIETQLWKLLSEARDRAKMLHLKSNLSSKEQKELDGLEEHILIHEQLIRISRTICDGIAWRNLGYNRTFLNSSARGFGAGSVNVNSKEFKSEFMWAHRISKTMNSLVILNDLTRFLRIGDLTEIGDGVAFVHEIKKYGKEVKNMFTLEKVKGKAKISNQAKRLLELQRIAFANKAKIYGIEVETKKIGLILKTYTDKIKRLFRESEKKLVVSENMDGCISIEVTNFKTIQEQKKRDIEELKKLSPKVKSTDLILVHSNWDTFFSDEKGNFVRSAPPYSIYPFSAKDCLYLMSGYYLVKFSLNVTKLKEILKRNNWEIEERTEADLDKQIADFEKEKDVMFTTKQALYEHAPDDGGLFTIKRGPFSISFDAMIYSRLTMEYLSLQSLLDILEELYRIASIRQRPDVYFPRFQNEDELWN